MEQGLAATVTNRYGNGEGNTVKHFYAGKGKQTKKDNAKMSKKKENNL